MTRFAGFFINDFCCYYPYRILFRYAHVGLCSQCSSHYVRQADWSLARRNLLAVLMPVNFPKSKYFLLHRVYVLSIDNILGNNQRKNLHQLIELNPPLRFLKSFQPGSPCVNVLPKLFIFDLTLFEFRYSNFFPRNKVILST